MSGGWSMKTRWTRYDDGTLFGCTLCAVHPCRNGAESGGRADMARATEPAGLGPDSLERENLRYNLCPLYQNQSVFLHGDFNGDGKLDMAVLITEKKSGQQGIAFVHSNSSLPLVVGTGTTLGNGSDDFNWLDAWSLCGKQPIQQGASDEKPPLLRGDALLVQKLEAASALIYWDGKAHRWYQQGD